MKRLTLIRHAKSDWNDHRLIDYDRPLSTRGKKAGPKMGKRMVAAGIIPQLLLSSPAKRARKTAQLMATELDLEQEEISYHEDIYAADLETLIDLATEFTPLEHIAIIGHNPGLTDFAAWLCPDAPDWLPTCAVIDLELNIKTWDAINANCGSIRYYDYPKKPT